MHHNLTRLINTRWNGKHVIVKIIPGLPVFLIDYLYVTLNYATGNITKVDDIMGGLYWPLCTGLTEDARLYYRDRKRGGLLCNPPGGISPFWIVRTGRGNEAAGTERRGQTAKGTERLQTEYVQVTQNKNIKQFKTIKKDCHFIKQVCVCYKYTYCN